MDMLKSIAAALVLAASVMFPNAVAHAATTVDISTGRGSGPLDGNWVVGGPGIVDGFNLPTVISAVIPTSVPGVWAGGATNAGVNGARWITPGSPGTGNQPFGLFSYSTAFTLNNIGQLTNKLLSGVFWADNQVFSIVLNGAAIYTVAPGSFNTQAQEFAGNGTAFSATSGFREGTNTLVFNTFNGFGDVGNAAGILVSGTVTAVPEPGTWLLLLLGFGAIGVTLRSRKAVLPEALAV